MDLYNAVIDHVIAMVTNVKLKDISWPIPEFIETGKTLISLWKMTKTECLTKSTTWRYILDSPPVSWNSTETLERLHSILGKLKLPMPFSPATDGKDLLWGGIFIHWHSAISTSPLSILPRSNSVEYNNMTYNFLGTWHSEHLLCLDYINVLLEEEPLKKFGFSLISR